MKEIKVIKYSEIHKDAWNDFLLKSNQDTFLFHRSFMEYHSDRFQDCSLMVYDSGKLVALMPANCIEDKLFSHLGLTYGGLIFNSDIKLEHIILYFREILYFSHNNGINKLEVKELPRVFQINPTNHPLPYLMFKLRAKLTRTDLHSVLDMNYKKYSDSRKRGVKRALKHGLRIDETEDFEEFWNEILIPNLKSKHAVEPVHSLKEITLLKSRFKNNIRQFNVYYGSEIVGGTTIFDMKTIAHSQYMSGNIKKNELGTLDFLHQHLLEVVFKDKLFFNFGISNENKGKHINEGLLYWKEGFGARSLPQSFYDVKTENYSLLDDVFI